MNKNVKKILGLGILIAIIISIFFILNNNQNKLNAEERKWVSENEQIVQNVHLINDANIFGNLGQGVYYNFIQSLANEYGIKINPVTMKRDEVEDSLAFMVGDTLKENSFVFYEDFYVLVGKIEENITSFSEIKNRKIGVLNNSKNIIENYLGSNSNTFIAYNTLEEMQTQLESGEINNIIIPRIENIDRILSKKYWISYHFSDLKRYYYVHDSKNTTFFHIIEKYYNLWKKELTKEIQEQERKLFLENLNISVASLGELQKKTLNFAYKNHVPYTVDGNTTFGGILSEIMDSFAGFAGVDIYYKEYKSDKKIIRDLNDNKIDLYFNYGTSISTGATINTGIPIKFNIYAHESNPIVINSLSTLKNYIIYVEENTTLHQKLIGIEGLQVKTYKKDKLNTVLKDKSNLIAMDSLKGEYLRRTDLEKYSSRFQLNLNNTYSIRSLGNETLNTLLLRYFNYFDQNTLINKGNFLASLAETKGSFINSLAKYALYMIILTVIILGLIYRSSKRVRMQKKLKKEDKIKLMDQLTSLKNRNYLNESLPNWNKNTIYPQSVIIIDLNKIQNINDTLGYEEGDRQIKGAANILIRSQLENTDIIRTNGNEFMIYLVGYSQKQITSYIHKLNKEFKSLPYEYGACITYSMILDDLKSIEDAINECIEDIKKQKENKKEEEK